MIQLTIARSVMAFLLLCILPGFAGAQVSAQKINTNQKDTVLFEQAQKALSKSNFTEARTLLTNLIDTYPDSGYVPRAKLSIADSWYSEHAFKQAEAEYRDFVTFFPNRPEVAEAQRRISSIYCWRSQVFFTFPVDPVRCPSATGLRLEASLRDIVRDVP